MNLNIVDSIRQLAHVNPNLNFIKLRNPVEKSYEKIGGWFKALIFMNIQKTPKFI